MALSGMTEPTNRERLSRRVGGNAKTLGGSLLPDAVRLLTEARQAVPVVNYALGLVGVAAGGSIAVGLYGSGRAAIIGPGFAVVRQAAGISETSQ
jgi:hypothetical protein